MKTKYRFFKKRSGFSLIELMLVFVLISILVAIIASNVGDLASAGSNKIKDANVKNINKMLSTLYAIGGKIGDGADNDVDTASAATLIGSLTKGLTIDDIKFSIEPAPNVGAYEVEGPLQNRSFKTLKISSTKPNERP